MPSSADVRARERTRAFARVIGPYIAVFTTVYAIRLPELTEVGVGLFARPDMVLMLGAMMLAGGLVIIGVHRNWRGPLAVTVSLFGWFVALRGLLLIAAPGALEAGVDTTLASPALTAAARAFFGCLAVAGLLLAYGGWSTRSPRAAASASPASAAG
jgi:hypothetical protein